MKVLGDCIRGFDFVRMKPAREVVHGDLPKDARCQVLAEAGRQYHLR